MSKMFKVKSMRNVDFGPDSIVRASVDLEMLPTGIVIKDCFLKEGQYGWFLSSPSLKLKQPWTNETTGKTHEWKDVIFFPKAIRDELNAICVEAYDLAGNYQNQTNHTADTQHPLAGQAEAVFASDDDGLPA